MRSHAMVRQAPLILMWLWSLLTSRSFGFVVVGPTTSRHRTVLATAAAADSNNDSNDGRIDVSIDPRLYRLRLSRATGIEWGTDLSFSFVYVRAMDPTGAAAMSGQISNGDQLCEIRPIGMDRSSSDAASINVMGAPFDFVMNAFAGLDQTVQELDLVFFQGTKEELQALAAGTTSTTTTKLETVTITVIQNKGAPDETTQIITGPAGCNLRQILVDHDINVYQSFTRWTNCKGKQLCGTCIVNVTGGAQHTNRKSMDEASTLRENPDSYRLSCVAFCYGDVTVETFPPISAAQWTR